MKKERKKERKEERKKKPRITNMTLILTFTFLRISRDIDQ